MKALYLKLLQTFIDEGTSEETKDLYRAKGIVPVQHIDFYAGQDQDPEYFEYFPCPAIFFSWSIDYKQKPAVATVTFRLLYEQLRDTSSQGKNTQEALKFLDFIEITDNVLHNLESTHTGKLELASEDLQIEPVITDEYILVYQCSYSGKEKARENPTGNFNDIKIKGGLFSKLLET
ncbi:hypothetical protein [Elizabethkingia meningoseptica]|uniref:hypothetical protein n=1 Tax=Elizabethkingia meningoseptica TaxID=238 RepID=UPI0023AEBC0D|nr:hypothetical protein [Elizabethkingia meningoseptica]MDE5525682.1 hypothetical protein [Elizabethkingia meningoseptica]